MRGDKNQKNVVIISYTEEGKSGISERIGMSSFFPKFHGHCYCCGCFEHAQVSCPLKQCTSCGKYGHDYRRCTK